MAEKEKAKKKDSLTVILERINNDTRISKKTRRILDSCPLAELRPPELVKWAKQVLYSAREDGKDDDEIGGIIKAFAKKSHWSDDQVNSILASMGLVDMAGVGGGIGLMPDPDKLISWTLKMTQQITGLEEVDLIRYGDDKETLQRKTSAWMLDLVTRMTENQVKEYSRRTTKLSRAMSILKDHLDEKRLEWQSVPRE